MSPVELIADTNVVSYLFRESTLGVAYRELIRGRPVGLTGLCLAELHSGAVVDQ